MDAYIPGIIIKKTRIMMKTLNAAVASFRFVLRHLPFQLRWNQKRTVTPHVNHDSSSEDEMLRSELNTGMALARIHTTIQNSVTANIQTIHSVFLLCSAAIMLGLRLLDGSEATEGLRSVFLRVTRPTWRMKNVCKYRADVIPKMRPVPSNPMNETA
jgi:hypothetical protein